MLKQWLASLSFACVLAADGGAARAQDAQVPPASQLTRQGRIMLSGAIGGFWSNDRPGTFANYDTWTLYVHPGVVYFLRDNVGIGVSGGGSYSQVDVVTSASIKGSSKDRDVSIGVEAALNFPITHSVSFMARPFLGYVRQWSDTLLRGTERGDNLLEEDPAQVEARFRRQLDFIRLAISAPFVFALSPNVGLGLGPELVFDILLRQSSAAGSPTVTSDTTSLRTRLGASASVYASF